MEGNFERTKSVEPLSDLKLDADSWERGAQAAVRGCRFSPNVARIIFTSEDCIIENSNQQSSDWGKHQWLSFLPNVRIVQTNDLLALCRSFHHCGTAKVRTCIPKLVLPQDDIFNVAGSNFSQAKSQLRLEELACFSNLEMLATDLLLEGVNLAKGSLF